MAEKSMNDVPSEVITHIMQYISFEDRKRARLVNLKWYYASIHPMFIKQELFTFVSNKIYKYQKNILDDFNSMIMNTKRKIMSLKFRGFVKFDMSLMIFEKLGKNILGLYFEDIHMLTDIIIDIILLCDNLKILEFKNINKWMMVTRPIEPILSLQTLVFSLHVLFFPDNIFKFLTSLAPNLVTLNLNFIVIENENPDAYENKTVTEISILEYIETAKCLRHLRLNGSCHIFNILPKSMQLKTLNLNYCKSNLNEKIKFKSLIGEHKSLQYLEVSYLSCCLLKGISQLNNLKELNIMYIITDHITGDDNSNSNECLNNFFASLNNFKGLRKLTIRPNVQINPESYKNLPSLSQQIFQSLQSLDYYISTEKSILMIGNHLTKLRIRNGDIFSATDFKILFEQLTKLRDLRIDQCHNLTDEILLQSGISNIKGLNTLVFYGGQLTYNCLQGIKFSYLNSLFILSPPLEPSTEIPDVQNIFKMLSENNPVLTHLYLNCFGSQFMRMIENYNILSNYFKHLKYCQI